jgi:hypothetical protein
VRGFPRRPIEDRLWERVAVDDDSGCWLWMGRVDDWGYGRISAGGGKGRELRVHRVAYELLVGPIPDGLVIDHLCLVKRCVYPDHLEPVTSEENSRRAWSAGLCSLPTRA